MDIISYKNYLVEWIKNTVLEAGMKGVIVGVSGGIDSALVVNLAKEAFPNDHLGVIIPIESSDEDVTDALAVVNSCEINHLMIDLTSTLDIFKTNYKYEKLASISNTKARLRMIQLYAIASEKDYLVLGTDNMCEWFTGFFTKYGDGGVDLAPIVHLFKSEVYEMCKLYNVPNALFVKPPNPGLGNGLSDEEEMGVTYNEIEDFIQGKTVEEAKVNILLKLNKNSEHKRNGIKLPEKKLNCYKR